MKMKRMDEFRIYFRGRTTGLDEWERMSEVMREREEPRRGYRAEYLGDSGHIMEMRKRTKMGDRLEKGCESRILLLHVNFELLSRRPNQDGRLKDRHLTGARPPIIPCVLQDL